MPPESVVRNHIERRALRRFPMKLPLGVRISGVPYEFITETENVSACGVFFYIDRSVSRETRLELTMHFSSQVTMTQPVEVHLRARVVRIVRQAQTIRSGVAAYIEALQFVAAAHGASGLGALLCPQAVVASR
jgi:hypothetical protein